MKANENIVLLVGAGGWSRLARYGSLVMINTDNPRSQAY